MPPVRSRAFLSTGIWASHRSPGGASQGGLRLLPGLRAMPDMGVATREVDGIWGGLDAEERRALNTQREVSNIARLVSGTGSGEPVSFPGSHRSRL